MRRNDLTLTSFICSALLPVVNQLDIEVVCDPNPTKDRTKEEHLHHLYQHRITHLKLLQGDLYLQPL
jgi:hypothetical protein